MGDFKLLKLGHQKQPETQAKPEENEKLTNILIYAIIQALTIK